MIRGDDTAACPADVERTTGRSVAAPAAAAVVMNCRRPIRDAASMTLYHSQLLEKSGRDGGIRTHDPLTPSQVRYQAALHPVRLVSDATRPRWVSGEYNKRPRVGKLDGPGYRERRRAAAFGALFGAALAVRTGVLAAGA